MYTKNKQPSLIQNVLSSLDMYAEPVSFTFKSQDRHSTIVGCCLSANIIVVLTISFIILMLDLLSYNNPNIVSAIRSDTNPEVSYLTPQNFKVVLGLATPNGLPIFNTAESVIYQSTMEFCSQSFKIQVGNGQTLQRNCTQIDLIPCGGEDTKIISEDIPDWAKNYGMCINETQWQHNYEKSFLQGTLSSDIFAYAAINVTQCKNTSKFTNCANQQKIDETLDSGIFIASVTNHLLNQQTPGDPFLSVQKTNAIAYGGDQVAGMKYIFRRSSLMDTINFFSLFPSEYEYKALTLQSDFSFVIGNSDIVAQLLWVLDDKTESYYRNYRTILDIFAQIGAFHSFLKLFFGLFATPFARLVQRLELTAQLFTLQDETDRLSQEPRMINSIGRSSDHLLQQKVAIKSNYITERKVIKLWMNSRRRRVHQKGLEQIKAEIDIENIVRRFQDVEKLKRLLMNPDQLKLFKLIPKPSITAVGTKLAHVQPITYSQNLDDDNHQQNPIDKLLRAYGRVKASDDPKDLQLLAMVGNELRNLMDEALHERQITREVITGRIFTGPLSQRDEGLLIVNEQRKNPFEMGLQ